jgi:hypothetical protein
MVLILFMIVTMALMVMTMAMMLETLIKMKTLIDSYTTLLQENHDMAESQGSSPTFEGIDSIKVSQNIIGSEKERPCLGFHDYWREKITILYKTHGDGALHEASLLRCGFCKVHSIEMDTSSPALGFTLHYRSDPASEELAKLFPKCRPSKVTSQELVVRLELDLETNKFKVVERKRLNIPGVLPYRVTTNSWLWVY